MSTRRDALLALALCSAASCARPQASMAGQPKRQGYLALGPDPKGPPVAQHPFFTGLRKRGWVLGDNLVYLPLYAEWRAERLAELAEDLVRQRVDVILCNGDQAALAAAKATRTIPIVFFSVNFPVELKLIESFARPGHNVTGICVATGREVSHKRLSLIRELLPTARRLSWLWPFGALLPIDFDATSAAKLVASDLGFELRFHPIHAPPDIDPAFADIAAWGAQAVVGSGIPVFHARQRVVELLLRYRLPGAFFDRELVDAGALLSYGARWPKGYATDRLADYVDRILRGVPPGELPVEWPSRYELVINKAAAKAIGLNVPTSLLARADEVIE